MKRILIFQENTSVIEVYDSDKTNCDEFSKNLTQLLQSDNITVLNTSESSVILRPSKVVSIVVQPIQDPQVNDTSQEIQKKKTKPKKAKVEEHEDIITDAD